MSFWWLWGQASDTRVQSALKVCLNPISLIRHKWFCKSVYNADWSTHYSSLQMFLRENNKARIKHMTVVIITHVGWKYTYFLDCISYTSNTCCCPRMAAWRVIPSTVTGMAIRTRSLTQKIRSFFTKTGTIILVFAMLFDYGMITNLLALVKV